MLSDRACRLYRLLYGDPCCTSAVLLPVSFGINSLLTGLPFSKRNLLAWFRFEGRPFQAFRGALTRLAIVFHGTELALCEEI